MHSCPVCDQACYCSGDIDDVDVGDQDALENCVHCIIDDACDDWPDEPLFDDDVEEEHDEDD